MLALTPKPKMEFFDAVGDPLVGGKLYTYEAGTSTPLATYTDSTGATPNTNPVILDAKGQASVWLGAFPYKFVLTDADDVLLPDGGDNIDPQGFTTSEWVDTDDVPTFINTTSFSVPNDKTLVYEDFRAVKLSVSAGTIYGHVLSAIFGGGITTITVRLKSGAVDSGISAISVGLITPENSSLPFSALILSEDVTEIAAATSTNVLGSQSSTINLTGAAPISITSFGTSLREGLKHRVTCTGAGAHILTYNATSLILPSGANITVSQGDSFWVEDLGANNCRVYGYTRATGEALINVEKATIQTIGATVAASALTITYTADYLSFRSSTLGDGTINVRSIASPLGLVVSSGSTLGTISAVQSRIAILAIDFSGTIELAAVNLSGGNNLDETTLITTIAEGGAGAADSSNVIYSTTARTNVPFRVVGYVESTQATAGTWATAPSTIQGYGGQAMAAMSSIGFGQKWQNFFGSRALATTYYNTTGKPITLCVNAAAGVGGNASLTVTIDSLVVVYGSAAYTTSAAITTGAVIIPHGSSYQVTAVGAAAPIGSWYELR